jgi:hypothetical protein
MFDSPFLCSQNGEIHHQKHTHTHTFKVYNNIKDCLNF